MIAAEETVLVLLAAGQSSRFGAANKLEAELLGMPVGLHVVRALATVPFRRQVAVTGGGALDYAAHGFAVIDNPRASDGMAGSVRLGVAAAREAGAAAVLIVLADMPRVTAAHVSRLLDAADGADAVVASSDGGGPKPPALFGANCFDVLLALEGDAGARAMLRAGRQVVAGPGELVDVDTPEELERLRGVVTA